MGTSPAIARRVVKIVLGYGLGVDSTAILLRWYFEPWTKPLVTDEETGGQRPAEWDEILVITAMTGNEWRQTGQLVREYMLPLLAAEGVRYVQVARSAASVAEARQLHEAGLRERGDNVTVLDDSTLPARLCLEGDYKLSQEMNGNGTVPQVGGIRKCSIKAKGEIIDRWLITELEGAPFTHVIGYEANELSRAVRDAKSNTGSSPKHGSPANRTGAYPLIEWNWDRAKCEAYITEMTGAAWIKSACTFCPFALANKAGQARVKDMYSCEPDSGIGALVMEYRSLALNPRQGLVKEDSLLAILMRTGRHNEVIRSFISRAGRMQWCVYEVQRVAMPTAADPSKGAWCRSVKTIASGSREDMIEALGQVAWAEGAEASVDALGIRRVQAAGRGEGFPAYERLYAVAPAGAADKAPKAFHTTMARYLAAVAA